MIYTDHRVAVHYDKMQCSQRPIANRVNSQQQ